MQQKMLMEGDKIFSYNIGFKKIMILIEIHNHWFCNNGKVLYISLDVQAFKIRLQWDISGLQIRTYHITKNILLRLFINF